MSTQQDERIEHEIVEKQLTAPRITLDHINNLMASLLFHVHNFPGTTMTVALAELNGFGVAVGQSACVSAANFDAEIGAKIAIENATEMAREKLWELEGYRLKKHLEQTANPFY